VQRIDALPILDAALRSGACELNGLVIEVARHDGLRGIRQARELTPLATPLAECRQESQLRLILHDGRIPTPQPQFRVFDEYGVELWRIDLAHEEEKLGTEFDGSSHLDRSRLDDAVLHRRRPLPPPRLHREHGPVRPHLPSIED